MIKLVSIEQRVEPATGKIRNEYRLEVDGRPYVTIERYQHAEDAEERAICAKYYPELVIKRN